MLHPGRVVEHQSASSCRAGRCVVVRRTRCRRVPSVESPVVTFVLCSLTPLLDMVTTVALSILRGTSHHSWLVALADTTVPFDFVNWNFCWFRLTASAVLLIGSVSEASDFRLNSLLALAAGLLFSCAGGCDCNRRAASSTACNTQYTRFADDTWFI